MFRVTAWVRAVIITDDRVCYLGDSVFDRTIMAKYDMPFLYSIDYQRQSLKKIKNLDFDHGLIAHSKNVYSKSEIDKIIDENVEVLDRYEADIIEILKTPSSREEILQQLLVINEIECNFETYHYNYSTTGAFIASLAERNIIDYTYDQGEDILLRHIRLSKDTAEGIWSTENGEGYYCLMSMQSEELKVKFKNIRREFQNKGEYSPIEFVTGRIKKVTSDPGQGKETEYGYRQDMH